MWILGCTALEFLQGCIPASFKTRLPYEVCALADVGLATRFRNAARRFPYRKQQVALLCRRSGKVRSFLVHGSEVYASYGKIPNCTMSLTITESTKSIRFDGTVGHTVADTEEKGRSQPD